MGVTGVRLQPPCFLLQVLDPRTRMILFKMLSRGIICQIDGCISTGKEVSHSPTLAGDNLEP